MICISNDLIEKWNIIDMKVFIKEMHTVVEHFSVNVSSRYIPSLYIC